MQRKHAGIVLIVVPCTTLIFFAIQPWWAAILTLFTIVSIIAGGWLIVESD